MLARLGEREASEWLTRAARAENADPAVFAEAAAVAPDDGRAEALLREGLGRAPANVALRAALVGFLLRTARAEEAMALAEAAAAEAPGEPRAWAATREAAARTGRWRQALDAAAKETALGAPPPPEARVALALGAEDRNALVELARAEPSWSVALDAFVDGRASEADLLRLGRLAPNETSRRFVARAGAPGAPPVGQLAGLLAWAHELASATPALVGLATAVGRAAEAFDRPLLVAVMGEFNAGKSSFVNALCGADVAPTGVTPTTATINVLRFGATPEARVVHHDGSARAIPAADIVAFLGTLRDADAREVRMVEIFLPVETLRRVEIVDTPGLNSIRPEHERVARDFLRDADAIVWVFAAGQAAKATEREALALAHAAGKRVVGVLNKIDRAEPGEVSALVRHVEGTLGDLVDPVVPFSATRATAAQKAGRSDPGLEALTAVLEHRFLADARELKRATATAALARFVESARTAAPAPVAPDLDGGRRALGALAQRLQSALDGERIALGARIDEGYRRAAFEVREFVQPRSWLFGEHRATPADEEFLAELLEDAVAQAAEGTRTALRAALQPATTDPSEDPAQTAKVRARVARAIEAALDRFAAYARGVIEGGAVPDFFRHQLPRLRLEIAAIRDVLVRRAPTPEEPLFVGLKRDLDAAFKDAGGRARRRGGRRDDARAHPRRADRPPARRARPRGRCARRFVGPPSATLAARAEEGRPPAVDPPADRRAALEAGFALAAVDQQRGRVVAALPIDVDVVAQRGAPARDPALQRGADGREQLCGPAGEPPGGRGRVDADPEQRLGDVDVSQTGDAPLVEQERLDRCAGGAERRRQRRCVELGERIRAERSQRDVTGNRAPRRDPAEAARVGETELVTAGERQHDVRVRRARRPLRLDAQPPRHPEVNDDPRAGVPSLSIGVDVDQDVLAAPAHAGNRAPDRDGAEAAQIDLTPEVKPLAAPPDRLDPPSTHERIESADDRFDFGQLRHRAPPRPSPRRRRKHPPTARSRPRKAPLPASSPRRRSPPAPSPRPLRRSHRRAPAAASFGASRTPA